MKKALLILSFFFVITSCGEDFLDISPAIGLSEDKLTDIPSMQALIFGAYNQSRAFVQYTNVMSSTMMRDAVIRRNVNYLPFFAHQIPNTFTSNMFERGYATLNTLNTVSNANVRDMPGTDADKNKILGDMHFLRALVYFDLNNYFTLHSTGNSVPLVLSPIGVNDRLSVSSSEEIKNQIESDIEEARTLLALSAGVADYEIATALAARIYFFHKKYDKAYEYANEIINSGNYSLEKEVTGPFDNPAGSSEVIFGIKFNATEVSNPSNINFNAYQPVDNEGFASLNTMSLIATLRSADPEDKRHGDLYTETDNLIYADGKYPTDQMDYIFIRYAEMYLTRAESNIMNNNAVNDQDIADINEIKNRAGASGVITGLPSAVATLDIIFNERSKELCFERGDRYLNTRRLEKDIINENGQGGTAFSQYADLLAFPFPVNEVRIHGLSR